MPAPLERRRRFAVGESVCGGGTNGEHDGDSDAAVDGERGLRTLAQWEPVEMYFFASA